MMILSHRLLWKPVLAAVMAGFFLSALVGPVQAAGKRPFLIAVDPGHGGKDPGAIGCQGAKEKNVTLAIAGDLARLIDRARGMRAVLTRKGDYYVSLRNRTRIALRAGAKLFVSIHADAGPPAWRGATVYTQSLRDATGKASDSLADRITQQLRRIEPARHDRRADFVVLRTARIPSVLVETGYITNPAQERELTNRGFQERIAAAIFRGIQSYLAGRGG